MAPNSDTNPSKHILQCWKHRALIALIVGGCFECLGYVGRAISPHNKTALGPYIIQSTFILLGPALFAASIYMILGRIIRLVNGEEHSLVRSTWLTGIFVAGDILSFLTQGSGAGLMSTGSNSDPVKAKAAIDNGQWIIIGGLLIQLVFFSGFVVLAAIVHSRARKTQQIVALDVPWQRYMCVLYGTSLMIFIRSVFRVIEYAQGNAGSIMRHEMFLYIFDSVLMIGVMVVLNVDYPEKLLNQKMRSNSHVMLDSSNGERGNRAEELK